MSVRRTFRSRYGEWAQQEGSLVSAYRKWEIAELRDELAAPR